MKFLYSPLRLWRIFRLLVSFYLLIKKRKSVMGFTPLSPLELSHTITVLGSSFVKLAQVLATRNDFFEPPYLEALKSLHDNVPKMSSADFETVFHRAFPKSPFTSFDSDPIASASIGQVHSAWIQDSHIAVKVRRLGIEKHVRADIAILSHFNALFRPLFSHTTRHSIESVIIEFSAMIIQECSMVQELSNLEKFSTLYAQSGVIFPRPYREYCSDDVLVMSYETGWRFDDKVSIAKSEIDIIALMDKLVRFYTDQMLVEGYFHADPHPGNLLVSPQGELILLDFGMVKRVAKPTRIAIIELLQAANAQDYEGYISASKRLGTVSYDAPVAELAEFTQRMFEIFANDALDSSSMQQLAFSVMEQTRNLPFKLPQEAIYILRVSAIIEGLGTTYVENFNGIKDILPILQKNIPRALGIKGSLIETIYDELKGLPSDLRALRTIVHRASRGELTVELSRLQLENIEEKLSKALRPIVIGVGLGLGAMGGWMMGYHPLAYCLLGGAIFSLVY